MAYLLVITNLYCNHQCSYCIQEQSSLDVRQNPKRVDVPSLLNFLQHNRIARSIKVAGGESSLHPDFEPMMEGFLKLYKKIVFTTNLNGKWYKDFDQALDTMERWGRKVQWNTTYHPKWMDTDLYIDRVKRMKARGINVDQVTSTDTDDLTDAIAQKLHAAKINWRLQTFTGRGADGRMRPQTMSDINQKYPQLYNPAKFINNYEEYLEECEDANYKGKDIRPRMIECVTSRFLIGPDNFVYPCHRHLYAQDPAYRCGSIHDVEMKDFKYHWQPFMKRWVLPCHTKCNACDFKAVKIRPYRRPRAAQRPAPVSA